MPSHWGNRSSFKIPPIIGLFIIGIIAIIIFPKLFAQTAFFANSGSTLSNSDSNINANLPENANTPNSNDPNTSSDYLNPLLPKEDNTLGIGKSNNEIATGYWILFVNNGTIQQIPVNSHDYSFLKELVNTDRNGTPTNQIFLVENGQIRKYMVSSEVNSVILNLANLYSRSSAKQSKRINPNLNPTSPDTVTPKSSPTPNSSPDTSSPGSISSKSNSNSSPSPNPSSNSTTPSNSSTPGTSPGSSTPSSKDNPTSNENG